MVTEASGREREIHLDKDHPWPGLISFTEADHSFFFGREREVSELARVIRQETVTVFFGKSGLGKSSILRAGVSPLLRESHFVPVYIRLNHAEEAPPLEDQVEIRIEEVLAEGEIEAPTPVRAETLWEYFHKKDSDWWDSQNRLVKPILIFDQFEELLTVGQSNPARAARTSSFLVELEDLVENRPPAALLRRFDADRAMARQYDLERTDYRVVLTLREDFLPDLEGLRERLRAIMFNRFRLLPLNGEQAMEVILKPGGHLVEEQVALRIVDFVSSSERSRLQSEVTRAQVGKRAIEPALLSVILQELNNRRIQAGQEKITAELVGNAQAAEIFQDFYRRGLQGMDGTVREFIEDCLLTSSGARNRIAEEDALTKRGMSPEAVTTLIDRRIVQRETTGNVKWLELTHDTLADVVRADRAEHYQRKQVELAAAREAEIRGKLSRVRKLAAAFAGLLVLAAIALGYAVWTHQRLVKRAEKEATQTVKTLRQELDNPAPGGAARVSAAMERMSGDAAQLKSEGLIETRAHALSLAAEILYFHGRFEEGLRNAHDALKKADELQPSAKDEFPVPLNRAAAHFALGRGLLETGRLSEAEQELQTAVDLTKDFLTGPQSDEANRIAILSQLELGNIKRQRSAMAEAIEIFRHVLELAAKSRPSELMDYVKVRAHSGIGLSQDENDTAAEDSFKQADDILEAASTKHPDNLLWKTRSEEHACAKSFRMMNASAPSSKTEQQVRKAIKDADILCGLDKDNLAWQFFLVQSHAAEGALYQQRAASKQSGDQWKKFEDAQLAKARESIEQALQVSEKIGKSQPSWSRNRWYIGHCHYKLGEILLTQKKYAEAMSEMDNARKRFEDLLRQAQGQWEDQRGLAYLLIRMAVINLLQEKPDAEQAITFCNQAADLIGHVPPSVRDKAVFQEVIALSQEITAASHTMENHYDPAIKAYRNATEIRKRIVKSATKPDRYMYLAQSLGWLNGAYMSKGDKENAAATSQAALEAIDEGLVRFPKSIILLKEKAQKYWQLADTLRKQGDLPGAADALKNAADIGKRAFDQDPLNIDISDSLKSIHTWAEDLAKELTKTPGTTTLVAKIQEAAAEIAPGTLLFPPNSKLKNGRIVEVERPPDWVAPPLIPGNWHMLDTNEQEEEKKLLKTSSIANDFAQADLLRFRSLAVDFYEKTTLYEAEVRRKNKSNGILTYLRRDKEIIHLDGTAPSINDSNAKFVPKLESSDRAESYLRFWAGASQAYLGTFRVLDSVNDLPWRRDATDEQRKAVASLIAPLKLEEQPDGKWNARCAIATGDKLFYELLQVLPDGTMVVPGESFASENLPLYTERFTGGLRIVSDYAAEITRLSEAFTDAFGKRQWRDAILKKAALIDLLAENITDSSQRQVTLPPHYVDLAWTQLRTKDFAGVLASAETALKLKPTSLPADADRAHALLLLGRTEEAREVYKKHIGESVNDTTGETWEQAIPEDFDKLEADGLHDPGFRLMRDFFKEETSKKKKEP